MPALTEGPCRVIWRWPCPAFFASYFCSAIPARAKSIVGTTFYRIRENCVSSYNQAIALHLGLVRRIGLGFTMTMQIRMVQLHQLVIPCLAILAIFFQVEYLIWRWTLLSFVRLRPDVLGLWGFRWRAMFFAVTGNGRISIANTYLSCAWCSLSRAW